MRCKHRCSFALNIGLPSVVRRNCESVDENSQSPLSNPKPVVIKLWDRVRSQTRDCLFRSSDSSSISVEGQAILCLSTINVIYVLSYMSLCLTFPAVRADVLLRVGCKHRLTSAALMCLIKYDMKQVPKQDLMTQCITSWIEADEDTSHLIWSGDCVNTDNNHP
jgi:hypothetical protein